ncbi:hypothetical protein [Massilia sp. Root418]|uniref:hypothetical protein n=1 Tax=Massilia sp. Root418 TaxID=1736532 RepID=UPI000ADD604D|nr:hypothetical protein [Massilia sp. Root418]
MSPSCFANLHGSGNRNAWKAIWLRFPGSDEWLLADVCRSARKAAIARLLGDAVQTDRLPQEKEKPPQPCQTASRSADRLRDEGAGQLQAGHVDRPPRSAPPAKKGGSTQRGSGRGSRRKRRAAKHHPQTSR